MPQRRTYWLSFCDPDRPKGDQFLGVAVVDVTLIEANAAAMLWPRTIDPWFAGAVLVARQHGCNPGGEVQGARIDDLPGFAEHGPTTPRDRLLSKQDMRDLGWEPKSLGDLRGE